MTCFQALKRYHFALLWFVMLMVLLLVTVRIATWPRLVTVDLTGIADHTVAILLRDSETNSEREQRLRHFSQELEGVLQRYAKTHHVILVPKEAVIAGAPDVTDPIWRELQAVQGGSHVPSKP